MDYHNTNSKKNTVRAYCSTLSKFNRKFGQRELAEITSDDALSFLNEITHNLKHGNKRTRYSHLFSFFNFLRNNVDQTAQNPCDTFMMKKLFRKKEQPHWDIIEKETLV